MEYAPEEYTKHYIVQALFLLMKEYDYHKINVKDIAEKAGIGRATFYRYFKSKDEVLIYYFEHITKKYISEQHFYPRCREDYVQVCKTVFNLFQQNKEQLSLMRKARLEYIYLDYLNEKFSKTFANDYPNANEFTPYLYAGMLFNVSMAWLDNDCKEPIENLSKAVVDAIYF